MPAYGIDNYENLEEFLSANCGGVDHVEGGEWVYFECPECHTKKASVSRSTGWVHCWHNDLGFNGLWFNNFLAKYYPNITVDFKFDHYQDTKLIETLVNSYAEMPKMMAIQVDEWCKTLLFERESLAGVWQWLIDKRGYDEQTVRKFKIGWTGKAITIPYFDTLGNLVQIKYRLDPRIREKIMYGEKGMGTRLFNVQALEGKSTAIICEGEFDAIIVSKFGFDNVVGVPGAHTWKDEWCNAFEEVDKVYVVFDKDSDGKSGAIEVAKSLSENAGCEVYIVDLRLPDGRKDITDYIRIREEQGKQPQSIKNEIQKLLNNATKYSEDEENDNVTHKKVFKAMKEAGFFAFRVEYRASNVFVISPHDPICAYDLNGRSFQDLVLTFFHEKFKDALSDTLFEKLKGLFRAEATALFMKEGAHRVHTRYYKEGKHSDTKIYFDMGDSKHALIISKEGYSLSREIPVRFVRSLLDMPQTVPDLHADCSDFKRLLNYTNLATDHDKLLYLCYIASGVIPHIRHNVLVMSGPPQTGKSTHMSLARMLLDPATNGDIQPYDGGFYSPGTDDGRVTTKQLQQQAQWGYCLYIDNLTGIDAGVSAYLCTLVTGGITVDRTLYTNNEPYPMVSYPLIGLNGVNLVATQPDLLSRSLVFETAQKEFYVNDEDFWNSFGQERPKILGGLYKVVSEAIRLYDQVEPQNVLRLGEAGHFMLCSAIALGYTAEQFVNAVEMNNQRRYQGAVEASTVAENLMVFAKNELTTFINARHAYEEGHTSALSGHDFMLLDYEKDLNRYRFTLKPTDLFLKLKNVALNETGNVATFPRDASHMMKHLNMMAGFIHSRSGLQIEKRKQYDPQTKDKSRFVIIYIPADRADSIPV